MMNRTEKKARNGIARLTQWFNLLAKDYGTAWPYSEAEVIIDIVGERWPDIKVYIRHLQEIETAARHLVEEEDCARVDRLIRHLSFGTELRLVDAKEKLKKALKRGPERTKRDAEWEGP